MSNPVTTSHHLYPPFPDSLPTAPLVSISLARLQADDPAESQAFFHACQSLGFFYLNLTDTNLGSQIIQAAEQLKSIQEQFYQLPQQEKEVFAREKIDPFFGYRQMKLPITNQDGTQKLVETYNLRKDDFVGNCEALRCHPIVRENWNVFRAYVEHCHQVVTLMLKHLERHLELSPDTLVNLHRLNQQSGDHIRFNRAPVMPFSEAAAKAGEHTDFGSLTILINWLGGLQIRVPDTQQWVFVKTVPGFAVVNLGDALVKFTAGVVRSNVHRVVPPPAPQHETVRDSLVYFARPENETVLKRLKGGLIDGQPETQAERDEPEITAYDWILRRSVGDLKGVYTIKQGFESREY